MITIEKQPGCVEIWLETQAGRWLLIARADTPIAALVDAEKLLRDDLVEVQEWLAEAKEEERR